MKLSVHLRTAHNEDAKRIAVLACQVWLHTYAWEGISEPVADHVLAQFTPQAYLAKFAQADGQVWVAERDAHLLGLAVIRFEQPCAWHPSATVELETLYVQTPFIGHGVGGQLLAQVQARARDQAHSPLWLTVNAHNHSAIDFYHQAGFSVCGASTFVLGDTHHDNHVMVGPSP